ncbi:MAG TPA: SCO family protein [Candidatus Udaeobacter sp.]|jgi:protein SCO1/2
MKKIAPIACVALALISCDRSTNPGEAADHYETRGVVRGFSPDLSTIEIQHENIPGFMPSMTMPFVARDPKEVASLKTGDAISFRMTVTQKDFWIDNVKKIRREDVDVSEPKPTPAMSSKNSERLKEGDAVPLFSLTNQNGEHISIDTFRGRPFVITFVFTRCPLPNFCPLMSNNFEQLQAAITSGSGPLASTRLLSVTLDPAFDTPEVLKAYAGYHHADPRTWSFATGDEKEIDMLTRAFSVFRQTEGGTISHGLATALIDKDGKIGQIWRGSAWKPDEVIEQIKQRGN